MLTAWRSSYLVTLQDSDNNYYQATKSQYGIWTVTHDTSLFSPIKNLPDGWDKVAIQWIRDLNYMGIFRSSTSDALSFSADGRAILQSIRDTQGLQGYCLMTMWQWSDEHNFYVVFYQCQVDFSTFDDDMIRYKLSTQLLETYLKRYWDAFGSTQVNIPCFIDTSGDAGTSFVADPDLKWIVDDGIKTRYQQLWTGQATATNPINYLLFGNAGGQFGPGQGNHSVLEMNPFNQVANNGATTFIANDLMTNVILPQAQQPGTSISSIGFTSPQITNVNEVHFAGANTAQPYTRANNIITNNLKSVNGTPVPFSVGASMSVTTVATPTGFIGVVPDLFNASISSMVTFALFEVGPNVPLPAFPTPENGWTDAISTTAFGTGQTSFNYIPILQLMGTNYTGEIYPTLVGNTLIFIAAGTTLPVELPNFTYIGPGTYYLKNPPIVEIKSTGVCYVLAMLFDSNIFTLGRIASTDPTNSLLFCVSDTTLTFQSTYNESAGGTATMPVAAPVLPATVYPAFDGFTLFSKLIQALPTITTNAYGFPVAVDNPFTTVSNFLTDPTVNVQDLCPKQILFTSDYMIHDLEGQSYITMAATDLFDFFKKVAGCGCAIENDTDNNPTVFRVENLGYFFDNTTKILDLGNTVTDFKISPLKDGVGAQMKFGYQQEDLNSDFGTNNPNTELYFNTPMTQCPGVIMDFEHDVIITNQFAKEKARAQITNQPVGQAYNPAQPSQTNNCYACYVQGATTQNLPNATYGLLQPYDPLNNALSVMAYQWVTYPAAQQSDPTARIAPFIVCSPYPDTDQNWNLSPKRACFRDTGALIRSYMYLQDDAYLTFRNTYIMQFNNSVSPENPSFASNLAVAEGKQPIYEQTDIPINTLPDALFSGNIFTITARTNQLNSAFGDTLFEILNTNNRGYVQFTWQSEGYVRPIYRGFVVNAKQIANNSAVEMTLWGTPDDYGSGGGYIAPTVTYLGTEDGGTVETESGGTAIGG